MSNRTKRAVAWVLVLGSSVTLACATRERHVPPDAPAPSVEVGALLDKDDAFRIARESGMKDGAKEWSAKLKEYPRYGLAWSVSNWLVDGAGGPVGIQVFVIDARTGALLDTMRSHFQWFIE